MNVKQFEFWAKRVIVNYSRNYFRNRKRRWEFEQNLCANEEGWCDDYFTTKISIAGEIIDIHDGELYSCIRKLKNGRENIILLHYFVGYTDRETGMILGKPKSTIHYNRNKALKTLKEKLGEKHVKSGNHRQCDFGE